jgi:hypothetical protein
MRARRDCGSCNLCCKLLMVPDIHKPANMTCWWTTVHGGCVRHGEKPDPNEVDQEPGTSVFTLRPSQAGKDLALLACASFRCLWLDSQFHEDAELRQMRPMRPDFTHVVMYPETVEEKKLLHVNVDPAFPDAWLRDPVRSYLNDVMAQGAQLEVIIGEHRFEISEPI